MSLERKLKNDSFWKSFCKRTNARTCIKLDKGLDCFMYFEKESGVREKLVSPKQKKTTL